MDHASYQHSLEYEIHEGNARAVEYRELARDEGFNRIEIMKEVDAVNLENDRLRRERKHLEGDLDILASKNKAEVESLTKIIESTKEYAQSQEKRVVEITE